MISFRQSKNSGALLLALFVSGPASAISLASLDDFQTGTLQNWTTTNAALSVANNTGPAGAGDFSIIINAGLNENLHMGHTGAEWTGNYTAAGITGIQVDARNINGPPNPNFPVNLNVQLRLSVNGPGGAFSTNPHIFLAPKGPWTLSLLLDLATLVPVQDAVQAGVTAGFNLADTLADVTEIRLVHSSVPAWLGADNAPIAGNRGLRLDNITAVGSLVPVPPALPLFLSAVAGLGLVARRRRR